MQEIPFRRGGRWVVSVVIAGLAAQGLNLGSAAGRPARAYQHPRRHQVLIVSANLQEAWNRSDNSNSKDLQAFARRIGKTLPHAPDVLLLQEVTRRTARRTMKLLEAYTQGNYSIAVAPGRPLADFRVRRVLVAETAILINSRTMRRVGKPRFLETTHRKRHGLKGMLREVRRNSAALLRERRTGMSIPVANLHFHNRFQLRTKGLNTRYRAAWSRKIARALQRAWPRYADNRVIAGDFNASRTRWRRGKRVPARWWKTLIRRGFRDVVYQVDTLDGVDYIFSRTRIAGGGVDRTYRPQRSAGSSSYYSDHKLRWALLGRWRPVVRARVESSTATTISWQPLPSAHSIRIQRRRPGARKWHLADRARGRATRLIDRGLQPVTRYEYRVIAWNGAEHSSPSRIMRVRTPRDTLGPRRPRAPRLHPKAERLAVKITWRSVNDRGGTGVAGYEVWRKPPNADAHRLAKTDKTWYVDEGFTRRLGVEYFIVAYDREGNRGERSPRATPLPKLGKSG